MAVPIYFKREVAVPPLRQGDHLTVQEFWRRYEATPKKLKAELIEGHVYMASPVSCVEHGAPHFDLITWLGIYRIATPGVKGTDNATVRLNHGANVPQPDASMWIGGGQCRVSDDGYLEGGPDLVGEISASSASFDLHEKLEAYESNRVREYIVWRVEDRAIDWFVLQRGRFSPMKPTVDGILKSKAFPGLWLDADAMIQGDAKRVFETLQQGIASPEHQKFTAKLQKKTRRTR
jgi:hypothetical protein